MPQRANKAFTPRIRRRSPAGEPHPCRRGARALAACFGTGALVTLMGCAAGTTGPMRAIETAPIAAQWYAPLPHQGQRSDLGTWWKQLDDPLLVDLINAAQEVSPTLAEATARIAEARAVRVAQRGALLPAIYAGADVVRTKSSAGDPTGAATISTISSAGAQASWEFDLFGAGRAAVNAAQARLEASQAGWHDARVSVAADVALVYVDLRALEAQAQLAHEDAESRAQTARITALAADAGLRSPAEADFAGAGAAEGEVASRQLQMQCELSVKALTALTGLEEPDLRTRLADGTADLPRPAGLVISAVPAEVLAQRPDVRVAACEVLAASADSREARARRWPSLSLGGSIGTTRIASSGTSTTGSSWSIGPVTVTLPIFDGGTRAANAEAARARYEAAATIYAASLRSAVHDVEAALVALDNSRHRHDAAIAAADGFHRSFRATEASYRAGMASLFELEDARRATLASRSAVIELQRERISAWIALYRALGGGWSRTATPTLGAAHD